MEARERRNWFIGATILTGIVFLLFLIPGTFFHDYFVRASFGANALGIISYGLWLWFLWFKAAGMKSNPSLILLVWLIFTWAALGGFNFSLP